MQEMYRKGQPLSEIMKANFSDMKMCWQWSLNIAEVEKITIENINQNV